MSKKELTEDDVRQAEEALIAAKKASHEARGSERKRANYQSVADELTRVRVAFRAQEEAKGTRTGVATTDNDGEQ